jgi:hypothetical protein
MALLSKLLTHFYSKARCFRVPIRVYGFVPLINDLQVSTSANIGCFLDREELHAPRSSSILESVENRKWSTSMVDSTRLPIQFMSSGGCTLIVHLVHFILLLQVFHIHGIHLGLDIKRILKIPVFTLL